MKNRSRANIVFLGRTGAGKSTFINYLLGDYVAPTGCGEPVTKAFDEYDYYLRNGISIRIFDSKGLEVDGFEDAVNEIIEFVKRRSCSDNVLDWVHSIFYCININRARLENEEVEFIKKISNTVGYPVHIIITHCRGANNADNERAMQNKILADLGESVKIYRVNSIQKKMRTGEIVNQFGKPLVIKDLIDLLWDNTAKKIASNYASQLRSGLFRIIDEMKRECIKSIDSSSIINLINGKIPGDGFGRLERDTKSFMREINDSYSICINSFLDMYCLFSNALGAKQISQFSQYILTYSVIFDDSLFGEVNRDLIVKANYSTTDVLLDMILIRNKIRNKCKEPIIDLHKKMRGRVPSQKKIEQDIFEMLQNAKEENARHSPVVRVYKKAGPNELCPCGSGRKFKKCCIGKGIYD